MNTRKIVFITSGVLLFVVYMVNLVLLSGYPIDDAYISLRYARNLALGNGLVYNPGEKVEGYTNFLWLIIQSGVIVLGGDPVISVVALGALTGIGTWLLVFKWARKWFGAYSFIVLAPIAYLGTNGYFIRYSVSGMETNMYGLFLLLGIYLATMHQDEKNMYYSILCFLAASLTRPEGVFYSILVLAYFWGKLSKQRVTGSPWLKCMLLYVVPYSIYTMWRVKYFGSILPNTYYVRVGKEFSDCLYTWKQGLHYLVAFLKRFYWFPLISLVTINQRKKFAGLSFCVIILVMFLSVVVLEGGDWMPFFRMMVPVIPLFLLLIGVLTEIVIQWSELNNKRVFITLIVFVHVVFISLLYMRWVPINQNPGSPKKGIYANIGKLYRAFLDLDRVIEKDIELGKWINEHAPAGLTMAVSSAGVVPYYAWVKTYDILGVTDAHIARTSLKIRRIEPLKPPPRDGKKNIQLTSIMPAHEKTDLEYVISKDPDIFLDGDPSALKKGGYKLYQFPSINRGYWARSPVRWQNLY